MAKRLAFWAAVGRAVARDASMQSAREMVEKFMLIRGTKVFYVSRTVLKTR